MYQMKKFLGCAAVVAALVICLGAGGAWAKDAVRTMIDVAPHATVVANGAFQTPGTYAVGTIKLDYFISAFNFSGVEETFTMCLDTVAGHDKPATNYAVDVAIEQIGSKDISLAVDSSPVHFATATSPPQCVDVTISVPEDIANDPDFQVDGTKLVGILQLSAPARAHLDTVTTIKVNLTLVHPSAEACVRALHLVADQNFDGNVSQSGITVTYKIPEF